MENGCGIAIAHFTKFFEECQRTVHPVRKKRLTDAPHPGVMRHDPHHSAGPSTWRWLPAAAPARRIAASSAAALDTGHLPRGHSTPAAAPLPPLTLVPRPSPPSYAPPPPSLSATTGNVAVTVRPTWRRRKAARYAGVLETEELVVALDLGDRPDLTRPGHSGSNSRAGGRGERPPRRQRTLSRGSRWARARAPRVGAGGLARGAETVRTVVPVALLMSSPCRLRESGVPREESSGRRGQAAALGAAAGRA